MTIPKADRTPGHVDASEEFLRARNTLLNNRNNWEDARKEFEWPTFENFNWALNWFDAIAYDNHERALWIVEPDGSEHIYSFDAMRRRSNRVANYLRKQGVGRGDRIMLMLDNQVELWDTLLAAMKLGAVVSPASIQLPASETPERIERARISHVVTSRRYLDRFADVTSDVKLIAADEDETPYYGDGREPQVPILNFHDAFIEPDTFEPDGVTHRDDLLLLYFTSGTTSKPKLVAHTHASYPVGTLTTMYWLGVMPGDTHMSISQPGWAKHSWSQVFAPWSAEACIFIYNTDRFDASSLMRQLDRCGVDTFCAPPTVWRMLIQADMTQMTNIPREALGAGEPLNPEVISQVERDWGVTIRDGYGQTETTALVCNSPGQKVKAGSMGRPCPGVDIVLRDPETGELTDNGEICVVMDGHPTFLTPGYHEQADKTGAVMYDGYYHTGDRGSIDEDGYITFEGRIDDVFKASDYRISPFELESVLLEHPAVAEAAVIPSPDAMRLAVPKGVVTLAKGHEPTLETAKSIMAHTAQELAGFKRVRRLEFSDTLPKTASGKIRRVELRNEELARPEDETAVDAPLSKRRPNEYWEKD
ncbi:MULTISPECIES: AMP-binding protein [unclassified Corynebacterium]|uniref:AMP-binding protein n=1 Tax=unclassified Corynebacterium TaxID=2624378 RepID=UPI0030AEE1ED